MSDLGELSLAYIKYVILLEAEFIRLCGTKVVDSYSLHASTPVQEL